MKCQFFIVRKYLVFYELFQFRDEKHDMFKHRSYFFAKHCHLTQLTCAVFTPVAPATVVLESQLFPPMIQRVKGQRFTLLRKIVRITRRNISYSGDKKAVCLVNSVLISNNAVESEAMNCWRHGAFLCVNDIGSMDEKARGRKISNAICLKDITILRCIGYV